MLGFVGNLVLIRPGVARCCRGASRDLGRGQLCSRVAPAAAVPRGAGPQRARGRLGSHHLCSGAADEPRVSPAAGGTGPPRAAWLGALQTHSDAGRGAGCPRPRTGQWHCQAGRPVACGSGSCTSLGVGQDSPSHCVCPREGWGWSPGPWPSHGCSRAPRAPPPAPGVYSSPPDAGACS